MLAMAISAGVCRAQTAPPIVTSPEWFAWYQGLLSQRLAECPRERAQTFYFSQSGDDAAGTGTIGNPWKSLAKAKQVIMASGGNVAVLFKRGEVWREKPGIDVSTPNITIGDYGKGPKPLFTVFNSVGSPSAWAPTVGRPNVYERPSSNRVMWAKQDDDLDRPWSRQRTLIGVEQTEGSWAWIDGVLYAHPRHVNGVATDPRVDGNPYEVAEEHSGPGVRVRGDGSRIENIRAQGWGLTQAPGTQQHGIETQMQGSARAVVFGCESHYGLSHVMTQWSGQGGIATFVQCKAGFCTYSANGGESMFNTYSNAGGGQTIFDHCEATHGTLPSDDFSPDRRNGWAFYGHTGGSGSYLGLTIVNSCIIRETKWGCKTSGGFDNLQPGGSLADVRCFIVGEDFSGGGLGTGEDWYLSFPHAARVNGKYRLNPRYVGTETLAGVASGWVINCSIELDCAEQNSYFSMFRSQASLSSNVRIWNSSIGVRTRPGQTFSLDWSSPPVGQSMTIRNSVISNWGGGSFRINGMPGVLSNNAYAGLLAGEYVGDPGAVVLATSPGWPQSLACTSPLSCRGGVLPDGAVLGFDQTGTVMTRNDIGPLEAVCANCDESTGTPLLTANDFQCFINRFAAGDYRANCDGSTSVPALTANDFTCFLNTFAAGCP